MLLQPGLNSQGACAHEAHGCKLEPASAMEALREKPFVFEALIERGDALKTRNVWVWWHTPFTPVFRKPRQANF